MSDWTPPTSPPSAPPAGPNPDPWAPVGATPTAPNPTAPVAPPSAPPLAPPGWSATNPPPPAEGPSPAPSAGSGSGGRSWLLGVAVFVLLAVIAGGIGLVAAGLDGDDQASTGPSQQAATEQRQPDDPPLDGDADEPVAAVAAAVSPAVVQLEVGQGLGSGVVYDAEGLIITAAHVVQGADSVTVRFSDGTAAEGEVLGGNAFSDIAVVKIDPFEDMAVAALGDSDELRPGQAVVALGSPFGLDQTVTSGIVSAVNRPAATSDGATAGGIVNMVQTDAAINPGNSGGPLVDIQGRVIGINDQIFSQGGGNDGIGLAVPINLAVRVADTLAAGEEVQFGFLGVGTAQNASTGGLETGAVIADVEAGSAAAESGLRNGDRVLSIDGQPVGSFQALAGIISAERPGDTVTLLVERGNQQQEIEVTLGGAVRD